MTDYKIDKSVIRDLWTMFKREHHCSVDRMVCEPELRNEFLEAARDVCGTDDEFTILWSAMNLRKAKKLKPRNVGSVSHTQQKQAMGGVADDNESGGRVREPKASSK